MKVFNPQNSAMKWVYTGVSNKLNFFNFECCTDEISLQVKVSTLQHDGVQCIVGIQNGCLFQQPYFIFETNCSV